MAVTQVVGPIIAPHFEGEWSATKTYEALAIVQYQGNSFGARQDVPTNIPITNEDFWVETGIYNAQLEAYRRIVLTLNARVQALEQTLANITRQLQTGNTYGELKNNDFVFVQKN